jgi:hypothetical protein
MMPPARDSVCDIAEPLRPHNNAVDSRATAEGATNPEDNFVTTPSSDVLIVRRTGAASPPKACH